MNSADDLSLRFLRLHDGRPGLRSTMSVEITEPSIRDNSCNSCPAHSSEIKNQNSKIQNPDPSVPSVSSDTLDFVSSDETLDRYDEIIVPTGWKLSSYHRNPVFQNAHQYGDVIFTLGRALVTEVRAGRLYQRIQFATDINPMAKIAHGLYKGKFLNAVSVGFIPLRWQDGTKETPYRRRYLEQELLEVSAVAIPANPNALALGLKSGAVDKSDLRNLADLINHALAPASRITHHASGPPSSIQYPASSIRPPTSDFRLQTSDLLTMARQLHDVLKHA